MLIDKYWEMKRNGCSLCEQLAVTVGEEISGSFMKNWLTNIEEPKYLKLDRVQEGVIGKLKQWKSKGIKIILATMRNNKANLYSQLESLDLLKLFDHIIIGTGDLGAEKADKVKPYIQNVDINSILWIGDTEADIYAARRLGVKIGAVSCGLRNRDFLLSLKPDFFFSDVKSIELDNVKDYVCKKQ
jgi:phosphoglycolate phosphatase-like HAD superfamily hydrolase